MQAVREAEGDGLRVGASGLALLRGLGGRIVDRLVVRGLPPPFASRAAVRRFHDEPARGEAPVVAGCGGLMPSCSAIRVAVDGPRWRSRVSTFTRNGWASTHNLAVSSRALCPVLSVLSAFSVLSGAESSGGAGEEVMGAD
ncbi:hypothetical protein SCALM49S_08931 [Streptomyces californicus]